MLTVTVLTLSVIMLVMMVLNMSVTVVLVFEAKGQSSLMSGCHVQSVLLFKLPSGLISLCLHLSQSSTYKFLLCD